MKRVLITFFVLLFVSAGAFAGKPPTSPAPPEDVNVLNFPETQDVSITNDSINVVSVENGDLAFDNLEIISGGSTSTGITTNRHLLPARGRIHSLSLHLQATSPDPSDDYLICTSHIAMEFTGAPQKWLAVLTSGGAGTVSHDYRKPIAYESDPSIGEEVKLVYQRRDLSFHSGRCTGSYVVLVEDLTSTP